MGAEFIPQVATVNLNDVRSMRSNFIARSFQASSTPTVQRVEAYFDELNVHGPFSNMLEVKP